MAGEEDPWRSSQDTVQPGRATNICSDSPKHWIAMHELVQVCSVTQRARQLLQQAASCLHSQALEPHSYSCARASLMPLSSEPQLLFNSKYFKRVQHSLQFEG